MLKKTVLRRKSDFSLIYGKGKSVGEKYVVLFVRKNNLPYNRVAFLASKKIGNSVARNRARRLMKESYRSIKDSLAEGYDIVFIARKTIYGLKCVDVKKSMETAAKRAGAVGKSLKRGSV
ncbi:MAG: ribonuclease P protein component [Clostridiales bacterium]|nr:ribonuclease P protein component [Clostridiales bacterium]